ncbi:MAG: hypothetical protein A2504_16060 [Bdellovibrionales bacterium RIFOXYD12_FULL_39_22]|nr:MAG: hypothetical protein A2385_07970 [Bdellovibrionales bacterium RIFOXYB1_FULL_39_21]OFZ43005.1 MAG: hypothetical protein A2485_11255 [Bdellovibrionales bacterium RIFOXYC12_FULL_39_17]OFZ50909.1 MAG: hypothetical protein A2404_06885 [Bdellovibrionales bacterium RIFOXYC1_FULL_39_130]OFZ73644.1 MAG: hypothetical protein A2451_06420 [Bdellovibrionales bacterium RIFOXYC2_FULL_39_8]OFZ78132.1 MAG: hypothetical protein A2560_02055 [Bdellovibrionales bacterium RIFOXYD1_FULL_39_84]OFZ94000.1 MAG:
MGLSTVDYLRSLYPQSKIYYAVPSWIVPLYDNVKISADAIIAMDLKRPHDWIKCWRLMRQLKIDLVYEMHQSGRSKKFFSLFSLIHRIPYFFHNHHLKDGTSVVGQGMIRPLIQRDLDGVYSFLGRTNNHDTSPPHYLHYPPRLLITRKAQKQRRIIFGVVATRATKMWPIENYLLLSKIIFKHHPDIEIAIPLSKSSDDLAIKEKFSKHEIDSRIIFVHLSLAELPHFFAESFLYIGNDTGIKHLAIAVGLKTYTFFGPEPPNEWHPYDVSTHPYFYIEDVICRTENAHYCGKFHCETMDCLRKLQVETVWKKISSSIR